MADLRNYQTRTAQTGAQAGAMIDQGLRSYMLRVYNLMAFGLAITGLVAFFASQAAFSGGQLTAFGQAIYVSPLKWVVMLAPLALVFFMSFRARFRDLRDRRAGLRRPDGLGHAEDQGNVFRSR